MIKSIYIILFSSILCIACSNNTKNTYDNVTRISYNDFNEIQTLKGVIHNLDSTILRPNQLKIFDTLLAVITKKEKHILRLCGLHSGIEISSGIEIGQGPNDLLLPNFVNNNSKDTILLSDRMKSVIVGYDINKFIKDKYPKAVKRVSLKHEVFGNIEILNKGFIAPAFQNSFLFNVYDGNGNITDSIGTYPHTGVDYSSMEQLVMFGFNFATNGSNRIAVCYNWTDLIDFYNEDGVLLKRLHGPDHFMSLFKEKRRANTVGATRVKGQTWDAYFVPMCIGDELWVVYSGAKDLESNFSDYKKRILTFGWDGTPHRILELDRGIIAFDVDIPSKKIYAISPTPEYHIVEYSYQ